MLESPICRFRHGEILLDVLPTSEEILGFGNRWYAAVLSSAHPFDLGQGFYVRLVSAPHFLATKFTAFESPNREDHGEYLFSRDFEDIVSVIDGRREIVSEIEAADPELRAYLQERIRHHSSVAGFEEGVAAHLEIDAASQARVAVVMRRLREIAG